jgi:hypothetical protein
MPMRNSRASPVCTGSRPSNSRNEIAIYLGIVQRVGELQLVSSCGRLISLANGDNNRAVKVVDLCNNSLRKLEGGNVLVEDPCARFRQVTKCGMYEELTGQCIGHCCQKPCSPIQGGW